MSLRTRRRRRVRAPEVVAEAFLRDVGTLQARLALLEQKQARELADVRDQRDGMIMLAYSNGVPAKDLAEHLGMTVQGVYGIMNRLRERQGG